MAFPEAASLFDDFNRANNPIKTGAAQWGTGITQSENALRVVGEQLGVTSAFSNGCSAADFGPDVEFVVEVKALPASAEGYVFMPARIQQAGALGTWDGYALLVIRVGASWVWQLRRYDNGSSTTLGGTVSTQVVAVGDLIGFSVVGKVLTAYHKPAAGSWSSKGTREDATYSTAGKVGIECGDVVGRYDNMAVGTISAGTVYNDSGSGTVPVAGTRTETASTADARSGTVAVAGTRTESRSAADARSGSVTVTGSGSESRSYTDSRSGTIVLTGARVDGYRFSDGRSGTVPLAGAGTDSASITHSVTGTIAVTGAGRDGFGRTDSAAGTIPVAGAGTDSSSRSSSRTGAVPITGTGSDSWSVGNEHHDSGFGTIPLSGSKGESSAHTGSGSGAVTIAGSGADAVTTTDARLGLILISGSGVEGWTGAGSAALLVVGVGRATALKVDVQPAAVAAIRTHPVTKASLEVTSA